jgi:hypothetical protein
MAAPSKRATSKDDVNMPLTKAVFYVGAGTVRGVC